MSFGSSIITILPAFVLVCFLLIITSPAFGEDLTTSSEHFAQNPPKDEWEVKITPYGFLGDFNGHATLQGFTTPRLEAGSRDIVSALDFVASGRVEVWHNRWGVILDAFYVDLERRFDTRVVIPPGTFVKGREIIIPAGRLRTERTIVIPQGPGLDVAGPQVDLESKLGQYDLAGSYRFSADAPSYMAGKTLFMEPIVGLRLGYSRQDVELAPGAITGLLGAPGRTLTDSRTYVEPFLGGNIEYRLSKKLSLSVRGDAGGFGIGSAPHLSWNFVSLLGIHFKESVILKLGYAVKSINYKTGSGSYAFGGDAKSKGPWIGLTIKL